MSHRLQGVAEPVLGSPLFAYAIARIWEYSGQDPRVVPMLRDGGCYPDLAAAAERDMGFVAWDVAPYDPSKVNAKPRPSVYDAAYSQRGLDDYAVTSYRRQRVDDIAEAMMRGWTVGIGLSVDNAFLAHDGDGTITSIDPKTIVGRHMVSVLAVDGDRVLIDNWWNDWGIASGPLAGCGWLSADLVGGSMVHWTRVSRMTPDYAEAA